MGKRGQQGHLRIESRSWVGYWHVDVYDATTGATKRKQKSKRVGPQTLGKFEARKLLAEEIERSTNAHAEAQGKHQVDPSMSLAQFVKDRWLPLREAKLRPGSLTSAQYTVNHILQKFGAVPLERLDKVEMQMWLNDLATRYSKSITLHCMFYLRSICEEAVEQDYLVKNPAKRLEAPRTQRVDKTTLTSEQFRSVIVELEKNEGPESVHSLMLRVCVACALRPSELLALRWRDFDLAACTFTLRETVYRGVLRPFTKTTEADEEDASLLTVAIPDTLAQELNDYRGPMAGNSRLKDFMRDEDFIFHNDERGNFLHKENILRRVLKPVQEKLGLPVLNFQVMRRTMATLSQSSGSVKDVQTHLRHKSPNVAASEYMQSIPESSKKMVNSVYDALMTKPSVA
jgi:integrase